MDWNYDMDAAPRGTIEEHTVNLANGQTTTREVHIPKIIIAAGPDGETVIASWWLPKEGCWSVFSKAAPPIAWMPWPTHPGKP